MKAEELRSKLEQLESAYEEVTKTAQREILQAKENLRKAETETLQGKVGLMKGKSEIGRQWQVLETLQAKHKKIQEGLFLSTCWPKVCLSRIITLQTGCIFR